MNQIEMIALGMLGFVVLAIAAWRLNATAFALTPIAILIVTTYPYFKRFTWLSHWFLGFADSIAVAGAWIGITAGLDLAAGLMTMAMMFWIAGFDIIYACQDFEVDRQQGLHSIPARFGIGTALWLSRISHLIAILNMIALGVVLTLSWVYWLGVATAAGLLLYEASLVSSKNLDKLQKAFFDMNGYISIAYMVSIILHFVVSK